MVVNKMRYCLHLSRYVYYYNSDIQSMKRYNQTANTSSFLPSSTTTNIYYGYPLTSSPFLYLHIHFQ